MTLQFIHRREYGQTRFYPNNRPSREIAALSNRISLSKENLIGLDQAGFLIVIQDDTGKQEITLAGYLEMLDLIGRKA